MAATLLAFLQNSSSGRVVNEGQLWVSQEGLSITDSGSNGNSVEPLQLHRNRSLHFAAIKANSKTETHLSLFKVNVPNRGVHWFQVLGPSFYPSRFMLLCSMFLYLSSHLKIKGLGHWSSCEQYSPPSQSILALGRKLAVLLMIFTIFFLENSFQLWNFTEIDTFVFFIFFHFCIWLPWNSDLV